MPFGAHETMEVHEILMEKINMITHFHLYAQQTRNPQLLDMIVRHQQAGIASYNELVGMTRGNNGFHPIPPNTNITGINNQQIRYGVHNPPQFAPQSDATLSDSEIAIAMLLCHKNAARNAAWAALECADSNLRQALQNSSANCNNQAYEVFLFMNQQGVYQVPKLKPQTAETFLHSYQPASGALEAQYGLQTGQNAAYTGGTGYGAATRNMAGPGGAGMNGRLNAGSRESVLYGDGRAASTLQAPAGSASMYGNVNARGQIQQ